MEFWLKQTESDKFRLPVNPESFSFSEKADNTSVNVNKLGEVNLLGYRKLKEGTMSSFFLTKIIISVITLADILLIGM